MAENLFLIIAALVIASAFWVVFSPNLIHSAVSLLFTLFSTAGLYFSLCRFYRCYPGCDLCWRHSGLDNFWCNAHQPH